MTDEEIAASLLALGAATVGESGGTPMHPRVRRAWPGASVAGRAFTASCTFADNLALHSAAAEAPPGSVLVAAVSPPECGYWGEVLTTGAQARGIRGLVIDGGVRDVAALEGNKFAVFSTMLALRGASKVGGGAVGCVVRVGDVEVATGDWVVADGDGVAVVAAGDLSDALARARARADKEQTMFDQLRRGATTVDLLDLDTSSIKRTPH